MIICHLLSDNEHDTRHLQPDLVTAAGRQSSTAGKKRAFFKYEIKVRKGMVNVDLYIVTVDWALSTNMNSVRCPVFICPIAIPRPRRRDRDHNPVNNVRCP